MRRANCRGYAFRSRKGLPTPLETDDIRRITHNWVEYGGRVMDSHAKDRRYEELISLLSRLTLNGRCLNRGYCWKWESTRGAFQAASWKGV